MIPSKFAQPRMKSCGVCRNNSSQLRHWRSIRLQQPTFENIHKDSFKSVCVCVFLDALSKPSAYFRWTSARVHNESVSVCLDVEQSMTWQWCETTHFCMSSNIYAMAPSPTHTHKHTHTYACGLHTECLEAFVNTRTHIIKIIIHLISIELFVKNLCKCLISS